MKLLAFKHERKDKARNHRIEREDWEFSSTKFIIYALVFVGIVFLLSDRLVPAQKEMEYTKPQTYNICYERSAIKYYDNVIDKVLIRDGYKYCDTFPMKGTGEGEWSCYDDDCGTQFNQQRDDKQFDKLLGIRYFIR